MLVADSTAVRMEWKWVRGDPGTPEALTQPSCHPASAPLPVHRKFADQWRKRRVGFRVTRGADLHLPADLGSYVAGGGWYKLYLPFVSLGGLPRWKERRGMQKNTFVGNQVARQEISGEAITLWVKVYPS